MFPNGNIPAERVGVCTCCNLACATACLSQTWQFSSTRSHLCVLAQKKWSMLLLRPPQVPLWHMDCSHLPGHFGRETGHYIYSPHRLGELCVCPAELRAPRVLHLGFPCNSPRNIPCCRGRHAFGLCLCRQPGVYQRGKKVKTCTSCLQLCRSPLGATEGRPISSPPSEVHMHTAAGKNTSGKVNISRDFCSSPLTFSIPDGYLQKTNTASCLDVRRNFSSSGEKSNKHEKVS